MPIIYVIMRQTRNIFLTAGHRGGTTGANAGKYHEAELAIQLRNDITAKLHNMGIVVVNDNDTESLSAVVADINKRCNNRDICIDIHFNAFVNASANGTEVLIQDSPTNEEQELSEDILHATCSTLGTHNRGVKREGRSQYKRLAMLSGVKCNSVLLEVCFISCDADMARYESRYNLLVDKLTDVIIKYLSL